MNEQMRAFLERYHSAAMTTLRADGTPHVARVGVALVDGQVWSSGTQTRLRTKYLRRDPRSTLFVFDAEFRWIALESRVTILDSPDAPELNLRLFQLMQQGMDVPEGQINWFGRTISHEEFLKTMVEEQRLIYELEIIRFYGMY
ncbi:MAG: pyridoxamine 5'-phosphate oxidase [Chloroflexi bacterium]|nr:MAG: pyridoxamine 5'-phosphate oxidase [Chloroflexota bacterium]